MRMLNPEPGRLRRYGVALLVSFVAFAATYGTWPLLGPTPWAFFFAAVISAAWFGGFGPSLLATAISAIIGQYFFFEPFGSFRTGPAGLVPTLVFLLVSLFIGLLSSARRQAETFERAERRRFQATVSSIGDAVIATDNAGRVTFMNGIAQELTGWDIAAAHGRRLEDVFVIVNETTRKAVENPVVKVLETGRIQGLANHTILIARDGSERPIDDSAAPIRDDSRGIVGVVLVFHDVTEKRKVAKALIDSEAFSRNILESITDAFFALDQEWRFTYVNPQAERILGREPGDLLGYGLLETFPGIVGSPFERAYRKAVDERVAISFTSYYPDHDRWYEVHAYPAAHGLSVYFRNVTERRRTEEALKVSEEQLRLTLESTGLGAWHIDLATSILVTDERFRAIFGIENDQLDYDQTVAVIHPEDQARVRAAVVAATRPIDPETYSIEYRVMRPDGDIRWVYAMGKSNHDGDRLLSFDGTVNDITERKLADGELKASEERYRTLFNTIDEGFCVIDVLFDEFDKPMDYRFLEMNPAFEKHTGLHGATGKTVLEAVPGHDTIWIDAYGKVALTGEPLKMIHEVKVLNRWFEVSALKYGEEGGRKVAVLFNDISARVKAEKQRQVALDRLDAALDAGTIAIWDWDVQGDKVTGDRNLARMFSVAAESLVEGCPIDRLLPSIHPDDRGRVGGVIAEALKGGDRYEADYRLVGADGSIRWGEARGRVVRDEMGRAISFPGVVSDITERKQAEESTRRRGVQFQKLAEIASRINSAHDVDSVIGVVTEEARQLLGAHHAATSMVLDSIHPQPINVVSSSYKRQQEPPKSVVVDLENLITQPLRVAKAGLDADPRWQVLGGSFGNGHTPNGWLAAPLVGRNGRSMGFIQLSDRYEGEFTEDDEFILAQLSQLAAIAIENARLYQELRSNDERKDEFLAMLAHELRNPLAAIGNAVLLSSKSEAREQHEWSNEVITRQMRHLSRLIDDLMDVSRITRGKIALRRDVTEATAILESAAATVKTLVDERKHTLDLDLDRGNLWVNGDPTRLEQVVVNLLNNAAKYSENAGHIVLSAHLIDGEVVISVKDDGVGIPPEKLPEMFELFAQGDRSLARSEGGLGIGLTVVKKLVEMHGGTITARSDGPGRGSEFSIRLPAAEKPSAENSAAGGVKEASPRRTKILIVDDNVDTARGMARLMKLLGHEVATAHDGHEAIEVARQFNPEFIMLDIGLPGMSGYEVAAKLRKEASCEDAMIVAVTGYGQDEDRRRSREAGFDYHLTKPVDHDALLTLLADSGSGQE